MHLEEYSKSRHFFFRIWASNTPWIIQGLLVSTQQAASQVMGLAASSLQNQNPCRPPAEPNLTVHTCAPLIQSKHARARSPRPHRRRRRRSRRRRWWMASTTSTSGGGGARPWRTALLTLRDESLASPSPTALLALLRRVLLSPASPSLAASAAALSPHEVRAAPDRSPLAPSAAAAARLDLTRCGVLPRMCRWDRMWRSSRRPPPRRPLAAPAPPTRCAASANW